MGLGWWRSVLGLCWNVTWNENGGVLIRRACVSLFYEFDFFSLIWPKPKLTRRSRYKIWDTSIWVSVNHASFDSPQCCVVGGCPAGFIDVVRREFKPPHEHQWKLFCKESPLPCAPPLVAALMPWAPFFRGIASIKILWLPKLQWHPCLPVCIYFIDPELYT